MDFDIEAPSIHYMYDYYIAHCISLSLEPTPKIWQKFLKDCGLSHISMSRLEVEDIEKYMLAKIKYGI